MRPILLLAAILIVPTAIAAPEDGVSAWVVEGDCQGSETEALDETTAEDGTWTGAYDYRREEQCEGTGASVRVGDSSTGTAISADHGGSSTDEAHSVSTWEGHRDESTQHADYEAATSTRRDLSNGRTVDASAGGRSVGARDGCASSDRWSNREQGTYDSTNTSDGYHDRLQASGASERTFEQDCATAAQVDGEQVGSTRRCESASRTDYVSEGRTELRGDNWSDTWEEDYESTSSERCETRRGVEEAYLLESSECHGSAVGTFRSEPGEFSDEGTWTEDCATFTGLVVGDARVGRETHTRATQDGSAATSALVVESDATGRVEQPLPQA